MSRRTMPYHRRYHGDALQGYMVLTLEERGAYTTILDLIYDAGGPIVLNERYLAGMMGVSGRKCHALVTALIAHGKLYLTPDKRLSNHRAERELATAIEISVKRAESAKQKGKSAEPTKKTSRNNGQRVQMQSVSKASAQLMHSVSTVEPPKRGIWSAGAVPAEKPVRKRAELATKFSSTISEAVKIPHEINDPPELLLSDSSVIPEPYIDNNPSYSVAARESSFGDCSHLVAALEARDNWRPTHPPSPAGRIARK